MAQKSEDGATTATPQRTTTTPPTPGEVGSTSVQQSSSGMKDPKCDDEKAQEADEDDQDQPMVEEGVDIETLQKPLILLKDLHSLFCTSTVLNRDDMEIEDSEAVKSKDELEKTLGITIAASWAKVVEKSLEALFWRLYVEAYAPQIEKHAVYVADSKKAGGVKEKVLLVDAPNGLDLMLCGPVSQVQGAQSKHVVSLGGLDFWVNPPGVPPQSDVCVPAWLAKGTSKQDQVTVKPHTLMMDLFLKETGEVVATSPEDEVRREAVARYLRDDNRRLHSLNKEQEKELKRLGNEVSEKSEKSHELIQDITRLQQELSEQKEKQHYEAKALKAKAKSRPEVKTQEVEAEAAEADAVKDREESKETSKEPKENDAKESGTGNGEIVKQPENETVTTDVVATSVDQDDQAALTVPVLPGPTQLDDTAADNGGNDNAKKSEQSLSQEGAKDGTGLGDEGGIGTLLEPPLPQQPDVEHPDSLKTGETEETEETGSVDELNGIPASDKVKFVKISIKCHSFLGFLLSGCLLWYGEEGIFVFDTGPNLS